MYLLGFIIIVFTFWCSARQPRPSNGVYSKEARNNAQSGGLGKKSFSDECDMDKPQKFSNHPNAFDAVFFSAANGMGDHFVLSAERRTGRRINGIAYLKLPEIGFCRASWLPDTKFRADSDDEWRGEGMHLRPVEPMRKWKLQFKGKMQSEGTAEKKFFEVEIDGEWISNDDLFNYDTNMSPDAAARAFAKEEWNKQYFADLEKAHQTHYEQLGEFRGIIKVPSEGVERRVEMSSFRDHSFGVKRDWKLMHRYVFHHIFLPNGWKAVVGTVCQPTTCTHLECGFVRLNNGQLFPIDSCSLALINHGEGGECPVKYSMTITAGGFTYLIETSVTAEASHFYGEEHESRILERMATFKVNGVPGYGITEWQSRNAGKI